MEYKASDSKDVFAVTGDSGKTYTVNIITRSCSCPQYRIRLKGQGICKHYTWLMSQLQSLEPFQQINKGAKQLLKEIQEHQGIADTELNKFGPEVDTALNQLIQDGEIYYDKRNHKYVVLQ